MSAADLVSLSRIVLTIPVALAILVDARALATVLFVTALGTDFLDGQLARRAGSGTALGRILDPVADKVLAAGVLGALLAAGRVPAELVLVVVLRDAALLAFGWLRVRDGGGVPPASRAGKVAFTLLGVWTLGAVAGVPWPPFAAAVVGVAYAAAGFGYAPRLASPFGRAAEGKR